MLSDEHSDKYSKNKEETTKPPRICFASWIKIKCRPCRAARFNWCVCPQLGSFPGFCSVPSLALDEQYMCLHGGSQAGLNPFPEGGTSGALRTVPHGKKGPDSYLLPFKQKPTKFGQLFLSHWKFTAQHVLKQYLNNPILLEQQKGDREGRQLLQVIYCARHNQCAWLATQTAGAKSRATDREQYLRNTCLLTVKTSTYPSISSGQIN